jgi:hypothetical protein
MAVWTFTFILSGSLAVGEEEAANRLYAAGCDDAIFSAVNGKYFLDFDREATTLEEAVVSAKADVEKISIGLTVDIVALPEEL